MTRWKREARTTLILMHEHNRWSRWYGHLLSAAAEMGLPVSTTNYPNGSGDGSWDREIYTCSAALERMGGLTALHASAYGRLDKEGQ